MSKMSERELLTLMNQGGMEECVNALADFLRSHGFEDAAHDLLVIWDNEPQADDMDALYG